MLIYHLLLTLLLLISCDTFVFKRHTIGLQKLFCKVQILSVGEHKNIQFAEIKRVNNDLRKFRINATLDILTMNKYLCDYKEELVKNKVVFRGFRCGSVPPYVMPTIRKNIIDRGLRIILKDLCDLNDMAVSEFLYLHFYILVYPFLFSCVMRIEKS